MAPPTPRELYEMMAQAPEEEHSAIFNSFLPLQKRAFFEYANQHHQPYLDMLPSLQLCLSIARQLDASMETQVALVDKEQVDKEEVEEVDSNVGPESG
jgi:hypothetical protein